LAQAAGTTRGEVLDLTAGSDISGRGLLVRTAAFRPGATWWLKNTTHPSSTTGNPPSNRKQKRPSRRSRSAGFAIDSTRRISDPVLGAPGFTVSEVGSVWPQTRHDVMN